MATDDDFPAADEVLEADSDRESRAERAAVRGVDTGGGWFSQTMAELGRVVWPTREELLRMTTVVVVTVAGVAAFIFAVDLILNQAQTVIYGKA